MESTEVYKLLRQGSAWAYPTMGDVYEDTNGKSTTVPAGTILEVVTYYEYRNIWLLWMPTLNCWVFTAAAEIDATLAEKISK